MLRGFYCKNTTWEESSRQDNLLTSRNRWYACGRLSAPQRPVDMDLSNPDFTNRFNEKRLEKVGSTCANTSIRRIVQTGRYKRNFIVSQ